MWEIGEKSISELIELVDQSALALPQFQRPSVWGKSNWIPFLYTILLGRPTGTLLLMEAKGDTPLASRSLETAPPPIPTQLEWLLLDGQQRTTTLYCATRTSFDEVPHLKKAVVNVLAAINRGELTEDDVSMESASKVPGATAMAAQGRVCYSTLIDEGELDVWRFAFAENHFAGDVKGSREVLNRITPGLLKVPDYRFPVLEIKHDTPLDVVADIFESMNRRGQPLNKFDLMVARLYKQLPDGTFFDLRESWEQLLDDSAYLRRVGVNSDDGMLPLQLIALQVSRLPKDSRGRVKGMTSASVLELPPEQVIGAQGAPRPGMDLPAAVKALNAAAEFLVQNCGVVAPSLLPQQAMLLPIADRFIQEPGLHLPPAQLKKWFFSVGLAIDYYGGVNSYTERDCGALEQWADKKNPRIPDSVLKLDAKMVQDLDLKRPFSRAGNILGRTVFALLVANGALDWADGMLQVRSMDDIDFHHMVPDQKLKNWYPGSKDGRRPIAALTPIRASTNRSIGSKLPKEVMESLGNSAAPTAASHQLDLDILVNASKNKKSFDSFVAHREKRLKEFIIQALGL